MQDLERRTSLRRRLRKTFSVLANLAAYPAARAWPRSGGRWAFGHDGDAFAGNPKYLFLWLCLHRPDLHPIWITGSRATRRTLVAHGYPVRMRWSPGGMLAALRAEAFFFAHDVADVNAPLGWGAIRINLWHGVGLKALQVSRRRGSWLAGRLRDVMFVPHDRVVATSGLMQVHFATQFGLPASRCPQLGYPRLDVATDPRLAAAAGRIDRESGFEERIAGYAEIYVYMPTFRDSERPFFERALPDLARLSAILAERDALLLIKPHPRTPLEAAQLPPNIAIWPPEADFYAHMSKIDLLITDYSSVLYDYLQAGRGGVILYVFDMVEYVTSDRTLVLPFQENIAGLQVSGFSALCEVLRRGSALDRGALPDLARICERFWGGSSIPASAAIAGYVESLAASSRAPHRGGRSHERN